MPAKADYRTFVRAGLCPSCKGAPRPGRRYCAPCAKAQCAWHRPRRRMEMAVRRAKARAEGQCSHCFKARALPGRHCCAQCYDNKAMKSRIQRAERSNRLRFDDFAGARNAS